MKVLPFIFFSFFIQGFLWNTALAFKKVTDMVLIPGGEFYMGSSVEEIMEVKKAYGKRDMYRDYPFDAESPKRKMHLNAFYIDRHEVTNGAYYEFVKATGHRQPRHWKEGKPKDDQLDHPVSYVSQLDAAAFAQWAGKRLPTAEAWEKAARGTDGRVFPWGNAFDPFKAATAESDIQFIFGALCSVNAANRIETAPGDVSPFGVRDLAGNVREWTSSSPSEAPSMAFIKGGSWLDLSVNARAAHKEYVSREGMSHIIGFRCVLDIQEGPVPSSNEKISH